MHAIDVAMQHLSVCSRNPMHAYSSHIHECPWCRRMALHKIADPFPLSGNCMPSSSANHRHATTVGKTALKPQPPLPKNTRTITTATPIPQRKLMIPAAVSQKPAGMAPARQPIANVPSGLSGAKQHAAPIPQSCGVPANSAHSGSATQRQCSPTAPLPSATPIAPAGIIPAASPIASSTSLFGVALPSTQRVRSHG